MRRRFILNTKSAGSAAHSTQIGRRSAHLLAGGKSSAAAIWRPLLTRRHGPNTCAVHHLTTSTNQRLNGTRVLGRSLCLGHVNGRVNMSSHCRPAQNGRKYLTLGLCVTRRNGRSLTRLCRLKVFGSSSNLFILRWRRRTNFFKNFKSEMNEIF